MGSTAGLGKGGGPVGLALVRGLLASLPAAVAYVAGPDLVFQFANEEYRQIVGWRELIGLPYREALPELAGQGHFEAIDRVVRTGEPFYGRESEIWIRRQGGEPEKTFLDFVYQPVRDDAGAVAGVVLFGADVTAHVRDRHALEELAAQLAESEERYRTLFETLPSGVLYYSADGSIVAANPAAGRILGYEPSELTTWPLPSVQRAVHEDGTPWREDSPLVRALRTGEVVADVVLGVPHRRTGELRWLRVTAVPNALDEQGRPRRAYAIFSDFTEQHRAETTLREGTKLLGRLRDANILGMAAATEQGIYDANDALLDMIGYTRRDVEAGRLLYQRLTPPEYASRDQAALGQLRATGVFQPFEKEYTHRDGRRVPVLVGGAATGWDPLRWVMFVVDLTARQRSERERAELLAREQAARVAADAARERLELLLGAGDLVAATGSRRELVDQVAQLVVPALSDHCVVFLPTAQGMLRAASVVDRDPARAATLEGLRKIELSPDGPLIPQVAFTQAATRLVTDVSASIQDLKGAPPEFAQILKRIRSESAIATPLLIGQRPVGVLVLGRGEGRPRFNETDMPVITELSRRLAAGLANVETFAREHTIAETLQHALLPESPQIAGLDLAVRYLPATGGLQVGGDWYDAFPVGRGRVGLVVGDVAGHSIDSASTMGQIRSMLRTYAIENPSPPDVLRRTNAAMSQLLPEAVATVFYAVLDLPAGDLEYASAGHPPALVTSGDGQVEYLDDAPGVMLGAREDAGAAYPAGHRRLRPGARLLLYTDGLIEDRQRDIAEGLSALAQAMRESHAQTAEQTCQSVQTALLGSRPRADDVCVLAIRLQGQRALRRLHWDGRRLMSRVLHARPRR